MAGFEFPAFYNYPPSFTLQPVKQTQSKQRELWRDLILSYCKRNRLFIINIDAPASDLPLFENTAIQRKLSVDDRRLFLTDLEASGGGRWLGADKRRFLVLWRSTKEWADMLYAWVKQSGMEDSVMSFEELARGDDLALSGGDELQGLPRELLSAMIRMLEERGKAKVFKGTAQDDVGIKFFAG